MRDDTAEIALTRLQRIKLEDDCAVRFWTATFGVSYSRLKEAVHRVGPLAADVARDLAARRELGRSWPKPDSRVVIFGAAAAIRERL